MTPSWAQDHGYSVHGCPCCHAAWASDSGEDACPRCGYGERDEAMCECCARMVSEATMHTTDDGERLCMRCWAQYAEEVD